MHVSGHAPLGRGGTSDSPCVRLVPSSPSLALLAYHRLSGVFTAGVGESDRSVKFFFSCRMPSTHAHTHTHTHRLGSRPNYTKSVSLYYRSRHAADRMLRYGVHYRPLQRCVQEPVGLFMSLAFVFAL